MLGGDWQIPTEHEGCLKKAVIDTNVVVSALRSKRGASFKLLMILENTNIEINLSVPLFLEYEDAAKRLPGEISLAESDIDDILDYIASIAVQRKIFFLWRPLLKDPKDDMVLEVAVSAGCDTIVTYNKKDFRGVEQFGIRLFTPKEVLYELGEIS